MSLAIRQATEADLVFVVHSWAKSYKKSHKSGLEQFRDYMQTQPVILRKILNRPGARVLVAYETNAKTTKADISGWLAYERGFEREVKRFEAGKMQKVMEQPQWPLVHYFYVKSHYRRLGIWTRLMREASIKLDDPMFLTCETGVLSELPLPRKMFDSSIARHPWRRDASSKEETRTETEVIPGRVRRRHTPKARGK